MELLNVDYRYSVKKDKSLKNGKDSLLINVSDLTSKQDIRKKAHRRALNKVSTNTSTNSVIEVEIIKIT